MIRSSQAPSELDRPSLAPDRLFEAAGRYEPEALGRVFDSSFPVVHGMLLALLGDPGAAEHIAASTYAKALDRMRDERTQRVGLTGWLAHTAALEAARHRPPSGQAPVGVGPRPYDPRRLRQALWTLASDQREVLALRLLAGIDAARVAAASGRSLGLVLSLEQRALRTLTRSEGGARADAALDRALDRVIAGAEPEAAIAAVPEAAGQSSALELARGLRTLLPAGADAAARDRVRTGLLAAAAQRRAHWMRSRPGPARHGAARRSFHPVRTAGRLATATFLAIVAVALGLAVSVLAVTSEPDSPIFYPLRRVAENVLVLAHRNPVSRAQLEVDLADQRLREADAMALNGHAALAVQAVHDRYVLLRQAARALIDDSSPHDPAWKQGRDKLVADESVSLQQLEEQLTTDGDGWAAQQVRDEVAAYQSERKFTDQELGSSPAPGTQPSPAPNGSSTAIP